MASRVSAPLPPTRAPTPRPVIKPKKKPAASSQSGTASPAPAYSPEPAVVSQDSSGKFVPLNTDQQALQMSRGFAERADNGDVIHTVRSETETPSLMARWYLDNPSSAKEILDYNGIAPSEILTVGRRIRIPFHLVKQFKAMPADYN